MSKISIYNKDYKIICHTDFGVKHVFKPGDADVDMHYDKAVSFIYQLNNSVKYRSLKENRVFCKCTYSPDVCICRFEVVPTFTSQVDSKQMGSSSHEEK